MLVKSILCLPPLQSDLVTLPALVAHLISNTYQQQSVAALRDEVNTSPVHSCLPFCFSLLAVAWTTGPCLAAAAVIVFYQTMAVVRRLVPSEASC